MCTFILYAIEQLSTICMEHKNKQFSYPAQQSRKIFWLAERRWTFDGRWGCHIRAGQCKAVRKITFLATPIVIPRGINHRRAFLMQSLEIGCGKDILKICRWDFSYSVVNKIGRRVKCQDFCILCRVALSWNLISSWSKSKSLMVVNLLIGIAEDQDHLENILTKGSSELKEPCQLKMAKWNWTGRQAGKVAWSTTAMVLITLLCHKWINVVYSGE